MNEPVPKYADREIFERLDTIDRSIRRLSVDLHRYLELECSYKILLMKYHGLERTNEILMRYEPSEKEKAKNEKIRETKALRAAERALEESEDESIDMEIDND